MKVAPRARAQPGGGAQRPFGKRLAFGKTSSVGAPATISPLSGAALTKREQQLLSQHASGSLSFPAASPAILTGLVAVIMVTWIATARLMGGMDAGPGTPLGGVGWFVGSWVIRMAAMRLPAERRFARVFAQLSRETAGPLSSTSRQTGLFLGGYVVIWTGYGLVAYGVDWALRRYASVMV